MTNPWYVTLVPAVFGLVGVIVGGLITSLSSYILDKRREERQRQKEEHAHAANLTAAARLVELDFRVARAYVSGCLSAKRWAGYDTRPVSLQKWEEYCVLLAPELSEDDWLILLVGWRALTHLRTIHERSMEKTDTSISDEMANYLEEKIMKRVEDAQAVLSRLAGGIIEPALGESETRNDA
jgi:hypothetical protein